MGYKILGFAVWHGAKWYARRRFGALASRKTVAAGIVGAAIVALAVAGRRSAS
jgi:hypothetical protein